MQTETERVAFSTRLNEALDDMGFPPKGKGRQVEVGKRWGVSQKGARKWLEGEGFPEIDTAIRIAADCKVAFEWLMTGRGPKRLPEMQTEALVSGLPEEVANETIDFVRFKIERTMAGDQLGRYLEWLDRVIRDRKQRGEPPKQ